MFNTRERNENKREKEKERSVGVETLLHRPAAADGANDGGEAEAAAEPGVGRTIPAKDSNTSVKSLHCWSQSGRDARPLAHTEHTTRVRDGASVHSTTHDYVYMCVMYTRKHLHKYICTKPYGRLRHGATTDSVPVCKAEGSRVPLLLVVVLEWVAAFTDGTMLMHNANTARHARRVICSLRFIVLQSHGSTAQLVSASASNSGSF